MHIKTSDQEELVMGFGGYICNWGLHICGLYETEAECDEILFGFFKQGCLDGDMQLYCPAERTPENFRVEFTRACPQCAAALDDPHRFSLLSARELYYPNGEFSPLAMDKGLNEYFTASQKNGPRNIRATAEMVWALEAIPGVEQLMVYESRLNYFIPGKPWISICLYNITKFSGAQIMGVLQTHPYTISSRIITQNPYFIDPAHWLAQNAPQYLPAVN